MVLPVLAICSLIVLSGFAGLTYTNADSAARSTRTTHTSTTSTTTTATTTTSDPPSKPLVFQGHSPVDLEVCYNSGIVINACLNPSHIGPFPTIVGCTSSSCTLFLHIKYFALFSVSPLSYAYSTGPTGTGCDTEYGPETITIDNPQPGTYTLQLFTSKTFFQNYGPGCPHSTTETSFPYTITITAANTVPPITGQIGQNSPNPSPITGSFSGDTITIASGIPTPVFPMGAILAVVVPLAALVVYMLRAELISRRRALAPTL
jgi:hypothetical protein